jgi:hypothetical protein
VFNVWTGSFDEILKPLGPEYDQITCGAYMDLIGSLPLRAPKHARLRSHLDPEGGSSGPLPLLVGIQLRLLARARANVG